MSNALAIASVSAVLKNLLTNGLIDRDPVVSLGDFSVTTLPPDRIKLDQASEGGQLNLFLYLATPNSGWRNALLPSRSPAGEALTNPPLALDLHYLLTAYGTENLCAEILLGYAMQVLHETPLLSRDAIRTALSSPGPVSGSALPAAMKALTASSLADQVEQLKITPVTMSTEEMSKLWSALQAHYRPTAAYQVSVVLIEGTKPTRPTLPVRSRNVIAIPFQQPLLNAVEAASGAADFVVAGSTLRLLGQRLRGQNTKVLLDGVAFTPAADAISETEIKLAVPADLPAGVRAVQVVNELDLGTPPKPHRGFESNVAAFLLHPAITVPAHADGEVAVGFAPKVGKRQRVRLSLAETPVPVGRPARGYTLAAPENNGITAPAQEATDTISFGLDEVVPGAYLVRALVDGADSALKLDDVEGSPTQGQFPEPKLTIP